MTTSNRRPDLVADAVAKAARRLLPFLLLLYYALIYLLIQMSVYGVTIYLPAQVEQLLGRKAGFEVGAVAAVPWVCALLAVWWLPRVARSSLRRRALAAWTLGGAALGVGLSATQLPGLGLAALCVAAAGFISVQPVFWTFPTDELGGAAAAGGIALINSCGAVGGFLAPNVRAMAEQGFASPTAGVTVLAALTGLAAVLIGTLPKAPEPRPLVTGP
ncbi:MAG: MFS transporter [Verrucomicrobia bacterium]|nr:MFS transporter [Verrucomicrobiota bacterium]